MKKLLFGIFAHPDDEAFGPSATLYKAAQTGTDVHLVLVTDGENGTNCDNCENLASVRLEEWQKSGEIIGIRSGIALHYPDGSLSNSLYLEVAGKITQHITKTLATYNEPVEIEFMTFEPGGISGHLDHIAVSYITTFVYLKLRGQAPENTTIGKLKYFCLPATTVPAPSTGWIYMPAGKEEKQIDEQVDFSDIVKKKLEIMKAHHSQREDMKQVLSLQQANDRDCFCDHFWYFKD